MRSQETSVLGLRARKKMQQRHALLEAASSLFRDHGYESARMDDIAAKANVATKTVYNYFTTKHDILLELLTQDRMKALDRYERVVATPPHDTAEAFAQLMRADLGAVETVEDKRLWRELMAARLRNNRNYDAFERNRRIFTRYIERLIRHFAKSDEISGSLISVWVEIVYAIHTFAFREYCSVETRTPRQFEQLCRRQFRELFAGWNRITESSWAKVSAYHDESDRSQIRPPKRLRNLRTVSARANRQLP